MTRRVRSFRVRGAVRGIVLRILLVAVVACGAVALVPFPLWQGVAVIAALVSVVIPRSMAAWLAAACLVFGMILVPPSPDRTALAVLIVPAVHLLGSLALTIPSTSRVSLTALLPSAWRFVIVQLLAQSTVFAVRLLAPAPVDRGIAWLAPAAAAVLLVVLSFALRAARRADAAPEAALENGVRSVPESSGGADVRGPS